MAQVYDRVWAYTLTTGTGTIIIGLPVSGYRTFAAAGVPDGEVVTYAIKDGSAYEVGYGVYISATNQMSRTLLHSSTGALLNLSGSADVMIAPISDQIGYVGSPAAEAAAFFFACM